MSDPISNTIATLDGELDKLRAAGRVACPTHAEVDEWMRGILTTRGSRPGRCHALRRPRKDASEEVRVLFERLRWHNVIAGGTGTLWGPMISSFRVDPATWDRIDTLAAMMGVIIGRRSWSDVWGNLIAPSEVHNV